MKRKITFLFVHFFFLIASCQQKNSRKLQEEVTLPPEPVIRSSADSLFPELSLTLAYLRSYYYDPTKLKTNEMLVACMEELQSDIASFAFSLPDAVRVQVQVDTKQREFDVSRMKDMGKLEDTLAELLTFVTGEMRQNREDPEEIENAVYSCVNGMLDALDPYSVLIKPKYTDELEMQTKGEYGGVGMVLSVRDWDITVIYPTPGTPAAQAGVKEGDKIVQINDESAINMPLSDAVDRIRGPENTDVTVYIQREGWKEPKKFVLRRQQIKLESVVSKWLPGDVLYLRINHFIHYTTEDLTQKFREATRDKKPVGIILDLANNPGGLLPQSITVSNAFLKEGVIVSTVGAPGTQKQVYHAEEKGTLDASTPMVVLVSAQSASASEIVAGALKGQDRALILGETTYGKGTVQQIFNQGPKQPVLKLTIREYLTPGDVSIQQVGVVPHVRFVSIGVIDDVLSLFWPEEPRQPRKRTRAIKSERQRPDEIPRYEIRHFITERAQRERKNRVEDDGADDDMVEFARRILVEVGKPKASETLASLQSLVQRQLEEEDAKLTADLKKRGVDWSKGSRSAATPRVELKRLLCDAADPQCKTPLESVRPGQEFYLEFQLENQGSEPLSRVYGVLRSPADFLDGHEYLYGVLLPGKTFSWRTRLKAPHYTAPGVEPYQLEVFEQGRGRITEFKGNLQMNDTGRPLFAFSFAFNEENGNGDGVAQDGETFLLHMKIKNIGDGVAQKPISFLRNQGDKRMFLIDGRVHHDKIEPSQETWATMKYKIQSGKKLIAELAVIDTDFSETVARRFELPSGSPVDSVPKPFVTQLAVGTEIFQEARMTGFRLARASGWFDVVGKYGQSCRIKLNDRIYGFAVCEERTDAPNTHLVPEIEWIDHVVPPRIQVLNRPESLTQKPSVQITGKVTHPESLRDFYIIVSNFKSEKPKQKVFYTPGKGSELSFDVNIPVQVGFNQILLVARHDKDLTGHVLLSVVREE